MALALALSLYIARGWVKQAASIKRTLDALAAGDPSARAEVFSDDELGAIAVALNRWHDEAADKVDIAGGRAAMSTARRENSSMRRCV